MTSYLMELDVRKWEMNAHNHPTISIARKVKSHLYLHLISFTPQPIILRWNTLHVHGILILVYYRFQFHTSIE